MLCEPLSRLRVRDHAAVVVDFDSGDRRYVGVMAQAIVIGAAITERSQLQKFATLFRSSLDEDQVRKLIETEHNLAFRRREVIREDGDYSLCGAGWTGRNNRVGSDVNAVHSRALIKRERSLQLSFATNKQVANRVSIFRRATRGKIGG